MKKMENKINDSTGTEYPFDQLLIYVLFDAFLGVFIN